MGRPPSNGGPAFRFNPAEVAEMEAILQEHKTQMPAREVLTALAEKFSASPERSGKIVVQMKQVWNWFQNRRYAIRAKGAKVPGVLNVAPMPQQDSTAMKNIPQAAPTVAPPPAQTVAKSVPESSQMEFEAKSARDGAWYDVAAFLSHRSLETGDADVLVRFSGFGAEEDEWVNVRRHVRQRSLPCESSECVAVLPGDLILCFQEGKEQALYFDAHVLDSQRRRHDVRGCRCRFLVRYDHDLSEEIVPLRKVCRRPETDYRLQQLHGRNKPASGNQQKGGSDTDMGNPVRAHPPTEAMQKPGKADEHTVAAMVSPNPQGNVPVVSEAKVPQPKSIEVSTAGNTGTSFVPSANAAAVISCAPANVPPANAASVTSGAPANALPADAASVTSGAPANGPLPNAASVTSGAPANVELPNAAASTSAAPANALPANPAAVTSGAPANVRLANAAAVTSVAPVNVPPANAAPGSAVLDGSNQLYVPSTVAGA